MPDNDTIEDMPEPTEEPTEGADGEELVIVDDEPSTDETEPESFPRSYVEELREEAKSWRLKAQRADELEKSVDDLCRRLHTELVRRTGRLADPTDMPFNEAHLDSPEALTAAIDGLLTHKPHLGSRRPVGNVGQGAVTVPAQNVDLAGILRGKAQ